MVESSVRDTGEYGFRHCVVASTWAFEAQGPGSIPGGGASSIAQPEHRAEQLGLQQDPSVGGVLEPT